MIRSFRHARRDRVRDRSPAAVGFVVRPNHGPALALVVALMLAGSLSLLAVGDPSDLSPPSSGGEKGDLVEGLSAAPIAPSANARIRPADEPSIGPVPARPMVAAISGTLRDAGNQPIRDACVVEFVDQNGRRRSAHGQHGIYTLLDLAVGTHWVTARADGYRSLEGKVELSSDLRMLRRDFTLQPAVALRVMVTTTAGGTLAGTFAAGNSVGNGKPLVPMATREPLAGRLAAPGDVVVVGTFRSREVRAQELPSDCLGVLLLDGDLPVCVNLMLGDVVLQSQRVGRGQREVSFVVAPEDCVLDPSAIRARVVDAATGLAIRGARLLLRNEARADAGVPTDERGMATVQGEPGRFNLHIWAHGHASLRLSGDLQPGRTTELGTIALEDEVVVTGRVLGIEDRPLAASLSLGIVDPGDNSIQWLPHESWHSGGNGAFALRGLGRRQYAIRTSNHDAIQHRTWEGTPWVSGVVLVDTRAGSIADLEIRLRPATRLVLHTAAIEPSALRFRVVDERGFVLVEDRLVGAAPRPLHMPPGSYRIALLDAQGALLAEHKKTLGTTTEHVDLVHPNLR